MGYVSSLEGNVLIIILKKSYLVKSPWPPRIPLDLWKNLRFVGAHGFFSASFQKMMYAPNNKKKQKTFKINQLQPIKRNFNYTMWAPTHPPKKNDIFQSSRPLGLNTTSHLWGSRLPPTSKKALCFRPRGRALCRSTGNASAGEVWPGLPGPGRSTGRARQTSGP